MKGYNTTAIIVLEKSTHILEKKARSRKLNFHINNWIRIIHLYINILGWDCLIQIRHAKV